MATYTAQPQPTYFDVPTFDGAFDFQFQVARQKQAQFDRGIADVKNQYSNMGSLPVSSQLGIAKRDAYMKEATDKLKKISGSDFSLTENQAAANSIYKPLTSDSDVLYDLTQSRSAQKQTQLMDQFQNSKDEKERAQYWDTGREYVNNSIMKLQNAKTSEELRKAQVRNFVPYSDIVGKLNKAATDLKLKVSYDEVGGGYIVTHENGQKANIPFYLFAQSQLGVQEREVLKVMGAVEGDRRIAMEMHSTGLDEGTVRQGLATKAITDRFDDYSDQLQQNQDGVSSLEAKRNKLLKDNGGDENNIPSTIISEIAALDDRIDMLTGQKETIETRIRNLGFNKIHGQYIQNSEYKKTLDAFASDLSLPYQEDAAKNVTLNWAAGLASATSIQKVSSDATYLKNIDLQIEGIKAKASLEVAENKAGAATKKAATTTTDEGDKYFNDPLLTGYNPYSQERVKKYEFFKQQEKSFHDDLNTKGIDLIQDAGLGLSADFLTALADNLKAGAANESIIGSSKFALTDPKYASDIEKLDALVGKKAQITRGSANDPYSYADVFGVLLKKASESVKDRLTTVPGDATDQQNNAILLRKMREVELVGNAYSIFKDDEKNISDKIFTSDPSYAPFLDKDKKFLNKEDFIANQTGFHNYKEFRQAVNDKFIHDPAGVNQFLSEHLPNWLFEKGVLKPLSAGFNIIKDVFDDRESLLKNAFSSLGAGYDKKRATFDKSFEDLINSGQVNYLQKQPGPNGELGYAYPLWEFRFHADTDKSGEETAQTVLKQAFDRQNLSDETKIGNISELGTSSHVMDVVKYIQSKIGDMKPEDGRFFYSQVGTDGKNPAVIFTPSPDFLKDFLVKGSPVPTSVINKIEKYGIEINAENLTGIPQQKPSLVARMIDINKDFKLLPELEQEGFSGRIDKKTNGRGYDVYLSYKTYDQNGNEVIKKDQLQTPGTPVSQERLDALVDGLYSDILNAYYGYQKQKKALTIPSSAPTKFVTSSEYQLMRKTNARQQ